MRKGITKRTLNSCDFKTAISQKKPDIPKGVEVEIISDINNLYGDYYYVSYDGINYYVDTRDLDVVIE